MHQLRSVKKNLNLGDECLEIKLRLLGMHDGAPYIKSLKQKTETEINNLKKEGI
jgi:hypothetical protein